jgi:hypothetical protein
LEIYGRRLRRVLISGEINLRCSPLYGFLAFESEIWLDWSMKKTRSMKPFGTAAMVGSALACATPAMAELQAGQCLPMAEMNAALRAEGQRTMIIGNRSAAVERDTAGNATRVEEAAEVITSNADGSIGFNLAGNRPREEASTQMCVGARLTNVRLFDARQTVIPRDAYLGGTFNTLVDQNAALGTRPMVVADTVFSNDNGGTRLGRPIVLFGNVEVRGASLVTYTNDGDAVRLALMVDTDYTPAAMEVLAAQRPAP